MPPTNKCWWSTTTLPMCANLPYVDNAASKVEWIVSVSMLNEGWDVKRVFQIVPHEERAFNSKLLIAQVLGRGLRVPKVGAGEQPEVTVFNHDAWATSIRHLVNEILEIEKRLSSHVLETRRITSICTTSTIRCNRPRSRNRWIASIHAGQRLCGS